MRHHLRKAREVYASGGLFNTAKSAIRYIPIELNNLAFRLRHGHGTRVIDEDWDNLFILDGCRYDLFAKSEIPIDGTLQSRISLGSSSEEFFERNFKMSGKYHDTVYINANPFIPQLGLDEGVFHAVINCLEEWDPDLQTVPPEAVAIAAKKAFNEFPNKRLIIHFMQPHTPFIGKQDGLFERGWTMDREIEGDEQGIWDQLRDSSNDIDLTEVWAAYAENLSIVLKEVVPLIEAWDGKSIITADHGNLVGERLSPIPTRRKYGHPYGVHTEELLKVPWFVVDGDQRREVTVDPPVIQESMSESEVEARLEALGYK